MSMVIQLSTLCVICLMATSSGWLYGQTTCEEALGDYCANDPDVVCDKCAESKAEVSCENAVADHCGEDDAVGICAQYLENIRAEVMCERSTDPLLCHVKNQHACNESSDYALCDTTMGFQYGCYGNVCWSQCVDKHHGDQEWCYLAKRQLGPRVEYECKEDAECKPSDLDSVMCSSSCGMSGTLKK